MSYYWLADAGTHRRLRRRVEAEMAELLAAEDTEEMTPLDCSVNAAAAAAWRSAPPQGASRAKHEAAKASLANVRLLCDHGVRMGPRKLRVLVQGRRRRVLWRWFLLMCEKTRRPLWTQRTLSLIRTASAQDRERCVAAELAAATVAAHTLQIETALRAVDAATRELENPAAGRTTLNGHS